MALTSVRTETLDARLVALLASLLRGVEVRTRGADETPLAVVRKQTGVEIAVDAMFVRVHEVALPARIALGLVGAFSAVCCTIKALGAVSRMADAVAS